MSPPRSSIRPQQELQPSARDQQGVRIDLAKRKQIRLLSDAPNWTYAVRSGCLTLDAVLPGERRQVMSILYPGDVISRSAAPPLPNVALTAILPSVLFRSGPGNGTGAEDSGYAAAVTQLAARSSLHGVMIGRLNSEERLSSLLIEMALHLGSPLAGGYTFEMPLTRGDMADYLALNPDTLSRLLTRFKSRGLIALPSRNRVIIRDLSALSDVCPIADVIRRMRNGGDIHSAGSPARG